ncbi:MAG TPA: hypothetical protein VMM78_08850, partial [Thermomicrobiales bacterium]|nr:hypothetical protein [Thermomicrobiales bacterium]
MAARRGGDHPNGPDAAPACGWPAAPAPTAQPGAQGRGPDGGATDRQPHAPPTEDTRGEDERERAGVDQRRRGWFWHWNSVVTQYAPLIGLKGVGLLNSYTVWTDRRDESPHRGYAFPSQQSEADFYGEERSELITINKILVALDLIEIRKEMVARTDERGRRWRVPHNLYRVKDRPLGVALRAEDVLCVTSLACDDPAVYRHVRRIFSPRFKPIDRDNVWHAILAELDGHPLWQAMRERTAAQESRASARSRAGHRTRAAREGNHDGAAPTSGQLPDKLSVGAEHKGLERGEDATIVDRGNDGLLPQAGAVARTNDGSSAGVAGSNDGSEIIQPTSGAASNTGQVPSVAPSNSTHHQPLTTTTTTTSPDEDRPTPAGAVPHAASASGTRALDVAAPVERPARPRAQLRLPGELALGGAGVGARDGAPAHDAERANAPPGEIASAAARSTGEAGSVAP